MPMPHATADRPDGLQAATDAFLQAARRLDPSERRQHVLEAIQTLDYHLDVDVLVVPRGTAGLQVLADEIVFVLQECLVGHDLADTLDITAELTDSMDRITTREMLKGVEF